MSDADTADTAADAAAAAAAAASGAHWLADAPASPRAAYVLAHGAGAGMRHAFLAQLAGLLAERDVAVLRFEFPYMAAGKKRVDPPAVCHAAVRAAVAEAARRWPGVPLFAGGKSFGGRMTSQAQAAAPLPGVRGLAFVGFPLHPPDKPGTERAEHLAQVAVPMLFLQGTRDEFAQWPLLDSVLAGLSPRATLVPIDSADHAFKVRGEKPAITMPRLAAALVKWMLGTVLTS